MRDPRYLLGCTVCDSSAADQVRAMIFGSDFWFTLASVAAPFPVLLIGIAAVHFGLPPFRHQRRLRQLGK